MILTGHFLYGPGLRLNAFLFAFCLLLLFEKSGWAQNTNALPLPSRLMMVQGKVEFRKGGTEAWVEARARQILQGGDRLRTGERSRAEVYLSTGVTIQKGEFSELEIPPSPEPLFKRGIFKVFNREPSKGSQLGLPNSTTAAIRGTDFLVKVDDAGNSELIVLDGEVALKNPLGEVVLGRQERGASLLGRPPTKSPVLESANALIQWNLYYPAVIYPAELGLTVQESAALQDSLSAYGRGDLLRAAEAYPWNRDRLSPAESAYRAALLLCVGQVERARGLISQSDTPAARSLQHLIDAVQSVERPSAAGAPPSSASELLSLSYDEQSRGHLEAARAAARDAVTRAPQFGFAWARLAEMEFGFGRRVQSSEALKQALSLSPQNAQAIALDGFLLAARGHNEAALRRFDQAIDTDGALGNAWLGRGLVSLRMGDNAGGLQSLMVAASREPQRSMLRSYLGKGFALTGDALHAAKELRLAVELDPRDPTPWLYLALLHQEEHRINEGIGDLERSQALNDNRQVYRSRQLLDEDRAVRGANLAKLYQDAGMSEVSVQAASQSVGFDPANYSAHLFLADSYESLRDPARFNLRYETVWFNELLLANILSPVGGGRLSQGVSAQEYSRLFDKDGLGIASSTVARSDGVFRERASQFGVLRKTGYALDLDYQYHGGVRPNNRLDSVEWYTSVKQQITEHDSALLLVKYEDYSSGDNFQYYNPAQARPYFSFSERQDPILATAWHHEWSPGVHTLILGSRLINEQRLRDRAVPQILLQEDAGGVVVSRDSTNLDVDYRNSLEIYSAELNQIYDGRWATLSAGGRYQSGDFESRDLLDNPSSVPFLLSSPPAADHAKDHFERATGYGYLTLKPADPLRLIGGLTYDRETFPQNFRHPPVTPGDETRSQWGPKAGFLWTPLPQATVRGVYAKSLGGVSLDESYRLEPTQIAGFPQAFRTLIPESASGVGSLSAPEFETAALALELKLGARTYAGLQAERLTSDVRRNVGVFTAQNGNIPATPDVIAERLDFEERSLAFHLNRLLGDAFAVGARYRVARADLDDRYLGVPTSILSTANPAQRATLHQVNTHLLFQHPGGFFARAEALWLGQQNLGYAPDQPGKDVFQENLYVGYRFGRGRGELRFGLLNLSGSDYRFNPLTPYEELPRKRVLEGRLNVLF